MMWLRLRFWPDWPRLNGVSTHVVKTDQVRTFFGVVQCDSTRGTVTTDRIVVTTQLEVKLTRRGWGPVWIVRSDRVCLRTCAALYESMKTVFKVLNNKACCDRTSTGREDLKAQSRCKARGCLNIQIQRMSRTVDLI
jgi:hypothetical protein